MAPLSTDHGSEPPTSEPPATASTSKPIHSLVLDTGPLIKNDPPASVLVTRAEQLYMIPSIITEIRDATTRSRVETTLLPFVTLRSPGPESLRFVQGFARKTGDLAVLSRPDLEVLALAYELECERNGGDWRLRNTPGQKGLNGRPKQTARFASDEQKKEDSEAKACRGQAHQILATSAPDGEPAAWANQPPLESGMRCLDLNTSNDDRDPSADLEATQTFSPSSQQSADRETASNTTATQEEAGDDSDDEGGWITPSNIEKHHAKDAGTAMPAPAAQKTLQTAVLTSDFAMQNVALRMNLNLITPSFARITHLKNWVLRCHGCFSITKDLAKQFCPSCGQPTLTRASCSTDEHGNFKVHLKKNFQWNNRGNVYSVPKPVHGSANGRLPKNVGGKNGWGRDLILAEDQKEYIRASDDQRRARKKDIMDDDYLPGILSGNRSGLSARLRVGAGRSVNAKRKH